MKDLYQKTIADIGLENQITLTEIAQAQMLVDNFEHVILSQGLKKISVLIATENESFRVSILVEGDSDCHPSLQVKINNKVTDWGVIGYTALLFLAANIDYDELETGIKYTRTGMRDRVYQEREIKAEKAEYIVKLANNIYGEHKLTNEKGIHYNVTLRDFSNKTGYIDNIDLKTNKLGTTKHILFLYKYFADNPQKFKKLKKSYPFIEIYTDGLNDYKISWFFPDKLTDDEKQLLKEYFGTKSCIEHEQTANFFAFIQQSFDYKRIKIRPEVIEKIEQHYSQIELQQLQATKTLDFSSINAKLYTYQRQGVEFSVFKTGVIIADEMGLGKTLQAIATAILKKQIFGFSKTLVITPASVKQQWVNEIEKFSHEKVKIIDGFPDIRAELYIQDDSFFHIINYETVLRDLNAINRAGYDFVILDEAQKIKNYETKTANAIKAITKKHALVITGTPIENKLLDLYSIVQFLDIYFLAPQWEFSYQHCIFDSKQKNKIHGYYNLVNLKQRLNQILIRREKKDVFEQLPNVIQKDIFVKLSDEQASYHMGFAKGIQMILSKKFKTSHDWTRLMLLLNSMRMVCDSTFLIDKETNISPKLGELSEILLEKLQIKNNKRKVIIFSEWTTMLELIGEQLRQDNLTFAMFTGKVPIKKRSAIITEFEQNPECNILLASEAGGAGLNLQVADTIINFELPWSPAKKNQRIGRIDRIGQKHKTLNVYNLITSGSFEMNILAGLFLKQNLFDGVLSNNEKIDSVNFNDKGKSQFIRQLEAIAANQDFLSMEADSENDQESKQQEQGQEHLQAVNELENLIDNIVANEASAKSAQNNTLISDDDYQQMHDVMNKGMDFLTGIFKMSTGKDLGTQGEPKVNIDRESGEVSITFKLK
ncbi:hypothetical protein MNBD_GAMMA01-1502 [hydrothermal vent metagenome]|uniref:Uncharacterized protein n=1 Tax=hydrothermal vent metagenome TaxID=652676 RepID=A0A3B0VEH9_9ZZZZ